MGCLIYGDIVSYTIELWKCIDYDKYYYTYYRYFDEKNGFGTILDALLVGDFVDLFTALNLMKMNTDLMLGAFIFIGGLFVMALGQYFYMLSGQECGPRDAFLLGIGKRLSKIPIGAVNTLILCIVFVAGWLLGGPIGIGTILAVFGMGTTICFILHFEPRHVIHKGFTETLKILLQNR